MVFRGEIMHCIMSGAKKKSNPNIESNWDCIIVDGKRYYVSDTWREKSYKKRGIEKTYGMVFQKILEIQEGE